MIDNTNRVAEQLGSVGPFVKVTWNDAASTMRSYRINAENPSEHLTVCETVGQKIEIMEIIGDKCTIENSESQQE